MDKQKSQQPKYGKIVNGLVLREYVGSGDVVVNGSTVNFALSQGIADRAPIVTVASGKRHFVLSWEDIIELAEQAGLFEDIEKYDRAYSFGHLRTDNSGVTE